MKTLKFINVLNLIKGVLQEIPRTKEPLKKKELFNRLLQYIDDSKVEIVFGKAVVQDLRKGGGVSIGQHSSVRL